MRRARTLLLLVVLIVVAFTAGYGYGRWYGPGTNKTEVRKKTGYHCPMHPSFRSDKPGDCGICGMKMVPDETPAAGAKERKVLYYRDPNAPDYRSSNPGLNPETGNELEPVYEDTSHLIHVPGEKQSWIGVRVGQVSQQSFDQMLRAPGRVAVDETRLARVMSRTDGWIETVSANFTGQMVRKGEPLLTFYSPELTASQQEYLLALKAEKEMAQSEMPGVHQHTASLVEAARSRLELHWGMTPQEIVELALSGRPRRSVTIRAPQNGFIVDRKAYPNQRITTETELYTLADLSRVWILADVFEADAPGIREGMTATIRPAGGASGAWTANVTYIQPQFDAQTRTLKIRLDAGNPGYHLRPEMFVEVEFHREGSMRVSVPSDAVLDSGLRQVVFVAKDDAHFEPRQVKTGRRANGMVEILSGLQAGEKIAVSGAFLLDSESQLKAPATSSTAAGSQPVPSPQPPEHRHD